MCAQMFIAQRPIIHPNDGFQVQLMQYESRPLGSTSLDNDPKAFRAIIKANRIYW